MSVQSPSQGSDGLRERNIAHIIREDESLGGSSGLDTPQDGDDVEKEKKTFGRTPSGTSKLEAGGVDI
jgi:phosphatidylethanolamine N-methyltransferase